MAALVWPPVERRADATRAPSFASYESVLPPSDAARGFACSLRYREPLYVVDGQIRSPRAANAIGPAVIESIELMDSEAATGAYGVRARDRVVLIATRATHPPSAR